MPNFLAIKIGNNFSYLNATDSRVVVLVKDFYYLDLILRKVILRQTSWSHTAMKEKPRKRPRMPPNSATKKEKVFATLSFQTPPPKKGKALQY